MCCSGFLLLWHDFCWVRFLLFVLLLEVEDNQDGDADGDGGVGDIEDGVEELELFAADEGHPLGPVEAEQREVEHIDDTSVEERCVAAFGREKLRDVVVALVEDESVEAAVDEVADSADEDERQRDDEERLRAFADIMHYGPHDGDGGDKAEKGQQQFADAAAEGHPEGHADILDEMELAPRADKGYLLPYL